jgi:hypothetical protein
MQARSQDFIPGGVGLREGGPGAKPLVREASPPEVEGIQSTEITFLK